MKSLAKTTILFLFSISLNAQNLTLTPGNQGKLNLPRLNYDQILAIPSPESGSIVYDITTNCVRFYNGTKWLCTDQKNTDFSPKALNAWKVSELDPINTNSFQSNTLALDNQGNIYISGIFNDNFKINGITYPPQGYSDVFVIKYNSAGVAQWVRTGGYQNSNTFSGSIGVDNQGNVFLAGNFFNSVNFGSFTVPANNSSGDVFLCKLSVTDGSVLALKAIGGSNYDAIQKIFVDNQSNVYITGSFVGNCNFDALSLTGMDSYDIFIAKYNANLQAQWVNKIVGTDYDFSNDICGDNAGNIYLTGSVGYDATFAPGQTLAPGMPTMFLAKYNATNGNYIWHKNQSNNGSHSYGRRIAIDSEGNVYLGGNFASYMVLGAVQVNGSNMATDLFIAKLSKDGIWQWIQPSFSTDLYDGETINDMKLTANDDIIVVCKASFFPTFGFADKRYAGYNFIFKFDKNGTVKGGVTVQSGMNQYLQSLAIKDNYYYLTGYFNGSVLFDNISLASPTYNGFVAKFID